MPDRLQRIELMHFRGATQLTSVDLDPRKPMTVVYGANGTGKTTLADAIDVVCNATRGSLADRSSTEARDLFSAGLQTELNATLTFGAQQWTWAGGVARTNIAGINGPADRPTAYVLRRGSLLQLMEAAPAERYKALVGFIDIEPVQKSEDALKRAVTAADTAAKTAEAVAKQAVDTLRDDRKAAAGNNPVPPNDLQDDAVLDWARRVAATVSDEGSKRLVLLEALRATYEGAAQRWQLWTDAIAAEARAEARKRNLEQQIEVIGNGVAASGPVVSLIGVLEQAQMYLSARQDSPCPVCTQTIDAAEVLASINDRLRPLKAVSDLIRGLDEAGKQLDAACIVRVQAAQAFVVAAAGLLGQLASSAETLVRGLHVDWAAYDCLRNDPGDGAKDTDETIEAANDLSKLYMRIATEIDTLITFLQVSAGFPALVAAHYEKATARIAEAEVARRTQTGLDTAHKIVMRAREAFTRRVFDTVIGTCNELYGEMHKEEKLSLTQLTFGGRSLTMEATMGECTAPPQALFSESHLDTLGLCFWLAFIRHCGRPGAVVVLDDVLNSADAAHQERILKVLKDVSKDYNQVIVTTHSTGLRDACLPPSEWVHLVELQPWSYREGLRTAAVVLP